MSSTYLQTERVRLRRYTFDDVKALFEMDSNPAVQRYLDTTTPPTMTDSLTFVERVLSRYSESDPHGYWIAELAHSGHPTFLGWFHLRPNRREPDLLELGYRLCEEHWGRGYATEVSLALVAHAFDDLDESCVIAETLVDNLGSRRVMEKVGMRVAFEFMYDDRLPAVRYIVERP